MIHTIRILFLAAMLAIPFKASAAIYPPPPVAYFSASLTSGTAPLTVNFTNLSYADLTDSLWNFGDGISLHSLAFELPHTYELPGTYTVQLTVWNPAGSSVFTDPDFIHVVPEPSTACLAGLGIGVCLARRARNRITGKQGSRVLRAGNPGVGEPEGGAVGRIKLGGR